MDWVLAIRRNRIALLAVVAAIVELLGGREGGPVSRRIRSAALALLRPAESAVRRLIVIAARGLVVTLPPPRPPVFVGAPGSGAAGVSRPPAFRLFDRWKRFRPMLRRAEPLGIPRIRSFWAAPYQPRPAAELQPAPVLAKPDPDAPVDPARLRVRLAALEGALADLPRQALRLARWRARREAAQGSATGLWPRSPLRPGRPPGQSLRPEREVDVVLRECHALALDALTPDTS